MTEKQINRYLQLKEAYLYADWKELEYLLDADNSVSLTAGQQWSVSYDILKDTGNVKDLSLMESSAIELKAKLENFLKNPKKSLDKESEIN